MPSFGFVSALLVFWQSVVSFIESYFAPTSKFSVNDIPDLTGRVVIVTGGNTGIGKETVKALLCKNAKVYLAARSEDRAKAAIEDLKQTTGKEAIFLKLDLSSLKSVKTAAEDFLKNESELHILFNNAGVMWPPSDQLTVDGYDMTWGTNVLGPFYFTKLLLPALFKASVPENKSRVVNTSSAGSIAGLSYSGSGLNFATFKDSPVRRKYGTQVLYTQSKLGNVVFAQEFARRFGDKIISTALHPGVIRSELARTVADLEGPRLQFFARLVLYPTSQGALTQLWAGTSPEGADLNGEYLVPWARVGKPRSNDPSLGKELWNWLEEQVANT
ncbi:NAD(P)-binding protein [Thelephora terrestris]|uniref:NAD(P)-binding protein n=1 Tax=Thelephora terrestris TaxID=56493 RepID=A0A9P6H7K7_9AGAM|nr:NAD(P)-binding protein [Thelephora terrestris]